MSPMEGALGAAFAGLAILFAVWIAHTLGQYLTFRKLAPSALLSWESRKPWFFGLCLGIGFFMVVLTLVSAFVLLRPALHVLSQALMAIYYTIVFPLGLRIRKGFYQSGIWTEQGFVPYRSIRWAGWKGKPEIVLAVRMAERPFRPAYSYLRVPGAHYGEARRILADRVKDQSLVLDGSLLGLETGSSAAEKL